MPRKDLRHREITKQFHLLPEHPATYVEIKHRKNFVKGTILKISSQITEESDYNPQEFKDLPCILFFVSFHHSVYFGPYLLGSCQSSSKNSTPLEGELRY